MASGLRILALLLVLIVSAFWIPAATAQIKACPAPPSDCEVYLEALAVTPVPAATTVTEQLTATVWASTSYETKGGTYPVNVTITISPLAGVTWNATSMTCVLSGTARDVCSLTATIDKNVACSPTVSVNFSGTGTENGGPPILEAFNVSGSLGNFCPPASPMPGLLYGTGLFAGGAVVGGAGVGFWARRKGP
ncbi:MAG: hypothetical protein QOE90_126 [Thermoplasmata archaeon]|jgi:hypothetical protein|nr:hypothetical protein [Thermoplasmata archaeon]